VLDFGGRKAPSGMGKISIAGVLRLRATITVSRNKSVRRSAQDDDFVEALKEHPIIISHVHWGEGTRLVPIRFCRDVDSCGLGF
jgi:hypothetical protein